LSEEELPLSTCPSGRLVERAKVLTHDVQVLLRQQRIKRAQQSAAEAHAKEIARYEKVLDLNRKCQEQLSMAAPAGEYSLEQLSRCKKDQLQCFVHARASKSALGLTSAVKKGTVTAAARGEDCLLRRAFCAQNRPVILEESVAKVLARQIAGIPLLPATVLTLDAAQPAIIRFVGRQEKLTVHLARVTQSTAREPACSRWTAPNPSSTRK